MKSAGITINGAARRVLMLMAGLGTAAALTLAPAAVGVTQAGATTPTPVTTTTTVVTNTTWTSPQGTGTHVLVECPNHTAGVYNYATLASTWTATDSWIWANVGQASCTGTGPGISPANSEVRLSTTFSVPGIPQGATLTLAADNGATVEINGVVVATLSRTGTPIANFTTMHTYTVTTGLVQGTNTITIVGYNGGTTGYNPAGVIARLSVLSTSTTANLCKKTGWRDWTSAPGPFANQGDCVSYFVKNPNGADPTIPNTASS